ECSNGSSAWQSKFQKVLKVLESVAGASGNSPIVVQHRGAPSERDIVALSRGTVLWHCLVAMSRGDVPSRHLNATRRKGKKKFGQPEGRPKFFSAVAETQLNAGVSGLSGVTTRMPTAVAVGTDVTPFVERTTTW
ncbi:MAG: hypothetical protein RL591_2048, partial [Planctomycetota bacterium]